MDAPDHRARILPVTIVELPAIPLLGISRKMSLSDNKTGELWRTFMPMVKHIPDRSGTDLYSLQLYPAGYFNQFDPVKYFEKWAAVKVNDRMKLNEEADHSVERIAMYPAQMANQGTMPEELQELTIPAGLYARFDYKGMPGDGAVFEYIFTQWLPVSGFRVDLRPHFEVLGKNYRNGDPGSEEEIYIPLTAS